ncbi:ADP-ribosylation/crystallin J1 [Corallococcus terminator]|uniref:ADP-ribosylation/crystallin J1 n=1 Tax=Corallococcus terminator TaxID=2316733 RepID=A0A3A8IVS7_9BACT|nr:ADP-ribosylation/crystallin J1 [Corallococcus terminator]RKG83934.1 ADP-ribosylation/crystallin J1 [Corallococcus terminator]
MTTTSRTLYRPVGLRELELILDADARAFPPRLPEQPIFYPVLNSEYAEQIARDWNTPDEASGYAGFVTAFDVDAEYLKRFDVKVVGASRHQELWVPAEALPEFNAHIQGRIQVTHAFYGPRYQGPRVPTLEPGDDPRR